MRYRQKDVGGDLEIIFRANQKRRRGSFGDFGRGGALYMQKRTEHAQEARDSAGCLRCLLGGSHCRTFFPVVMCGVKLGGSKVLRGAQRIEARVGDW